MSAQYKARQRRRKSQLQTAKSASTSGAATPAGAVSALGVGSAAGAQRAAGREDVTVQVAVPGPFYGALDYQSPIAELEPQLAWSCEPMVGQLPASDDACLAQAEQLSDPLALAERQADTVPSAARLETILQPGMRLQLPLGRRQVVGVVMSLNQSTAAAGMQLRPISAILEQQPVLSKQLLKLAQWAADYYQYPLGEVVLSFLPRKLRTLDAKLSSSVSVSPTQADAQGSVVELAKNKSQDAAAAVARDCLAVDALKLNAEQAQAVNSLQQNTGFQVSLLWGVTGSGKTEVYLHALHKILNAAKQALVLVPEISLTPQTVQRFSTRFNVPVHVWHSKLTPKQQYESWLQQRTQEPCIVIGTRSACFSPLPNLGIIIIDEEHDLSFKQASKWRYHARDVAVMRARFANIPLLLGTATPSLESLHNALQGRYQLLRLSQRATGAAAVQWHVIDQTQRKQQYGLSEALLKKIKQCMDTGKQALVFLNRRGYAPLLRCLRCGWHASCKHCDRRMTLHHYSKRLLCHHCLARQNIPAVCPSCKQTEPVTIGLGTERLELALKELFPEKNILRIDRDTTRRKGMLEQSLSDATSAKADILLGTQMLAKGHHFPQVALVVILEADGGLFSADFRGPEHLGQLLVQVAGRAGREKYKGEVVLQTYHPQHPYLKLLIEHGYAEFSKQLLQERRAHAMPPHYYYVLIRTEAKLAADAQTGLRLAKRHLQARWQAMQGHYQAEIAAIVGQAADDTAVSHTTLAAHCSQPALTSAQSGGASPHRVETELLRCGQVEQSEIIQIQGPVPAPMERADDRYRAQLLLQSVSRPLLQKLIAGLGAFLQGQRSLRKLRWSIDVDPHDMN